MSSSNRYLASINGLRLLFFFSPEAPVRFLDIGSHHFAGKGEDGRLLKWARLVELQAAGLDQNDHHGNKYTGTEPAGSLRYHSHRRGATPLGPKLEIRQKCAGLTVTSHLQFLGKLPAFRSWTVVSNREKMPVLIDYISTFSLLGFSRGNTRPWSNTLRLHLPANTWYGECQWRSGYLADFGLDRTYRQLGRADFTVGRLSISNQGTWSTCGHLPMGLLENEEMGITHFWQIEHNGSWQWEIGDLAGDIYLKLSGPTYHEGLWSKNLGAGEKFQTVPATFGRVAGGAQEALRVLTSARRRIRRPHPDMERLPVIFNDYMNCLGGNPTTAALLPLVDRAAKVGCEVFVIDAGWYARREESWWNTVGEWEPSASRFPNGLSEVIEAIRRHGMTPGLWLEIEVIGIACPLARELPDDWFFQRAGRRVIDHGRYQLDFRNPGVRTHADGVIKRLVREFGIGYVKMDYNINAGPGTDYAADAPGDGLLEHNRAYLHWVESVLSRHTGLVIENCASGGMRLDYSQLSVHSIQSISDQTDYRINGLIAAACASAACPEQAAIWSYPLRRGTEEETIFNMVNALLLRIHQSGRIQDISPRRLALVKQGIAVYKKIRAAIPRGLPFWPLGLPRIGDGWAAFGLDCGTDAYLAVWRLDGKNTQQAFLLPEAWSSVSCIYPESKPVPFQLAARGQFKVRMPKPFMARLFALHSRH
ncbi:MAG TPA: glycoside hydrolase family 36 protein [Chthoniobacteraceae bacterium]|jgi:alpha-galactosidase|nr:glycoside hydrolase family 36 protein [Chthoniobacteraceae bacterium]